MSDGADRLFGILARRPRPVLPALVLLFVIGLIAADRRTSHPTSREVRELLTKGEDLRWNPAAVRESVVLIGDTGTATAEILEPLEDHLRSGPVERTTLIFLGDNIYNYGLPPEGEPHHEQALRRLGRQLDLVKRTGVNATFIPGNHDWASSGSRGDEFVRNQQREVEAVLGERAFEPNGACPGPATVLSTAGFNIVAMDSHWFLHKHSRPALDGKSCPYESEAAMFAAVEKSFEQQASQIGQRPISLLVEHHPLISYGEHGRDDDCPNDMGCPRYQQLVGKLLPLLDRVKPDICASGHDHGLQLIKPLHGCGLHVVSGGGSHLGSVGVGPDTIFGAQRNGFMRVDILEDGRATLTVFFIDTRTKRWEQGYSRRLR